MGISLCLATYNEKSNLPYVLGSTYEWVDEVIVVDGGSTDGTREAAQAYGPKVRIIQTDNPPMFHINKQKALEAATQDWILQLDADEEIPLELRHEILATVKDPSRAEFAYQIPRKNYFLGRFLMKGGVYPDYTIRLYQRSSMYFPCEDVHENVEPTKKMQGKVATGNWLGKLTIGMNHYSDPTFERYQRRWVRYCKAEAIRVSNLIHIQQMEGLRYYWWLFTFAFKCVFILPLVWFFKTYFRHLGILDGWQGLVFHFMSAIRWWGIIYYYLNPRLLM